MKRRLRQYFAMLLAVSMLFTALPATALAQAAAPDAGTPSASESEPAFAENETPGEKDAPADGTERAPATDEAPAADENVRRVQALIDALPDAEDITEDTCADAQAQLTAVDEAKLLLTDGEREALDTARYEAAVAALSALTAPDGRDGEYEPVPIDIVGGFDWSMNGPILTLTGSGELDLTHEELPRPKELFYTVIINGATSIADGCFKDWTNLQSVTLPDGLTSIGDYAFDGCSALEQIRLPRSVVSIGRSAFCDCSSLMLTELPAGLTNIEEYAFARCSRLMLTELPAGVTSIGRSAFYGCSRLTLTELPAGVTSIDRDAFSGCLQLALTELPAGVTSIGEDAFRSCESLMLTELPAGVTTIGDSAFHGCESLMLTELPDGVTSIGDFAFDGCDNITHLTMPASLASMGWYVFQLSDNLTTLTFLGDTAPAINERTFQNARGLQKIFISVGAEGYEAANGWPMDNVRHILSGLGTEAAPYLIPDKATLEAVRDDVNNGEDFAGKVLRVTEDIDLEDENWTPIRTFAGTFDGDDHTISGLHIEGGSEFYLGLFGDVNGGTVKNVTVEGSIISRSLFSFTGGVVEHINNGTVENCTNRANLSGMGDRSGGIAGYCEGDTRITNCVNIGNINLDGQSDYAGGITAWSAGLIENCRNEGAVGKVHEDTRTRSTGGIVGNGTYATTIRICINTGVIGGLSNVGGIIGASSNEMANVIDNCENSGSVIGYSVLGGIAGAGNTIRNCRNYGPVTGELSSSNSIGGISGVNYGTVGTCQNAGTIKGDRRIGGIVGRNASGYTVENCYNTGDVSGSENVGGIVGENQYDDSYSVRIGTVKNCYNIGEVACEVGSVGGIAGLNKDGAVVDTCYYLDTCGGAGEGTAAERWQFASGEITYLLQKGQSALIWGQKLGTDDADEYPVLTSDEAKRTYQIAFRVEDLLPEYEARLYANPGDTVRNTPEMPRVRGYVPVKWALTNAPDGAAFTGAAVVNADMTVYGIYDKCGGLTVSVTVDGTGADPGREWHFRIELDDPYFYGDDELPFTDGAAEFTLKAGESRTVAGLAPGTAYAVTELNGDADGYATVFVNGSGVIESGKTLTVQFTNTFGSVAPEAPETPESSGGKPTGGESGDAPRTGDESRPALWLTLAALSALGVAVVAPIPASRRRMSAGADAERMKK